MYHLWLKNKYESNCIADTVKAEKMISYGTSGQRLCQRSQWVYHMPMKERLAITGIFISEELKPCFLSAPSSSGVNFHELYRKMECSLIFFATLTCLMYSMKLQNFIMTSILMNVFLWFPSLFSLFSSISPLPQICILWDWNWLKRSPFSQLWVYWVFPCTFSKF